MVLAVILCYDRCKFTRGGALWGASVLSRQTEIKFHSVYAAARLIEPVLFEAMQERRCDDGIDFLTFRMPEQFGRVAAPDAFGRRALRHHGKGPAQRRDLRVEPSYSRRLRADKNITIFNQKLKRRAQIQSDIAPRRNGTYTVTLAFNDDESQPILKMELMVPGEAAAATLPSASRKIPSSSTPAC